MLNILKLISNPNTPLKQIEKKGVYNGVTRYYPSANKEWFNSAYAYNKNTLKLLPVADNEIIFLIRSYFNMYTSVLEKKLKMPRMRTWMRRLSSRKIWVSKAELKHTNDKVIVNLYIYNRQSFFILKKLKKLLSYNISKYIVKILKSNNIRFIKDINKTNKNLLKKLNLRKELFDKLSLMLHKKNYIHNLMKKCLKKEIFLMHYMQSSFINRYKFKSTYISPLVLLLGKIYRKKVVLNIVKLKAFYFNSDILMQILTTKTKNRKNRIANLFNRSLVDINIPNVKKSLMMREPAKLTGTQNIILSSPKDNIPQGDILNEAIKNNFILSDNEIILNSLKNKSVSGIRLEASGRLTKRIIAARSLFKLKHKGTLKDIDSSYKGSSSVILRGNTKSNWQVSKSQSKTRIGSFGLKGWISSI